MLDLSEQGDAGDGVQRQGGLSRRWACMQMSAVAGVESAILATLQGDIQACRPRRDELRRQAGDPAFGVRDDALDLSVWRNLDNDGRDRLGAPSRFRSTVT